ncbi:MAG TPA: SH3 domain-containing protein [Thermoanaerobaculia bacterium]|nr:SH3 domain-containing protein [Thermoanaerobaculia bacterium]
MRRVLVAAIGALSLTCGERAEAPPARDPIGIRYVATDEMPVRGRPAETGAVTARFGVGERVSILAERGEWVEVRITFDRSGWARRDDLSDSPLTTSGGAGSAPRFRTPPSPVFSPTGVSGEIVLEAQVNTDGDIVGVRTLRNTTGRPDLEAKNAAELRGARFYPLIVGGARRSFVYEHRVEY